MSTETPWYFALKRGDKIRVVKLKEDKEPEIWEVYGLALDYRVKLKKGTETARLSHHELWEFCEPVPPAPVYMRPDPKALWYVYNDGVFSLAFPDRDDAEHFASHYSTRAVVPYSATTPTAPPEPVVPVAKVREWIDDTVANLRGISFIRNRLNDYLAENPKQEPQP